MKTIRTEIRKSEHAGLIFALPVQGNSNEVKYVGIFAPHTTRQRNYDDGFIASTRLLKKAGEWDDVLYAKAGYLAKVYSKLASYLPYIYLSIGMEDGRKYIFRIPVSALFADEGDEIEIAELDWKEFLADHEATYQTFVASVKEAMKNGELNALTVLFFTDYMRPQDAEEIQAL